jgi:phage-related protein
MKTLTSPVSTSAAAAQSGWVELYDFYLAAPIVTPWGTMNIIRLCTVPGGFAFFAPNQAPEPMASQSSAQNYMFWPIKRDIVKSDTKFQDDKIQITASNVTSQFAAMLALVNWYDTPVIIRKVPLFQTSPTTNDCVILFTGLIDFPKVTSETVQFSCSGSFGELSYLLPSENMHAACRFRYADDQCTQIPFLTKNYQTGTCGAGSSKTNIKSANFTSDTGLSSGYGTDLVNALPDASISASSAAFGLSNAACTINVTSNRILLPNSLSPTSNNGSNIVPTQVVFTGTTLPTIWAGLGDTFAFGVPYYIANGDSNGFQIWKHYGHWSPNIFDFLTAGSGLTCTAYIAPGPAGMTNQPATISTAANTVTIANHGQQNGTLVMFGGTTLPSPISAGVAYFIIGVTTNTFQVSLTSGGPAVVFTTAGTAVTCSTLGLIGAHGVKASQLTGWAFTNPADWGNQVQGYYQIPDAQSGLKNAALTPWIQFDFGPAVTPCTWQVSSFAGVQAEERVRLIEFFSSPDGVTWKFESYFEVPLLGGVLCDVLIPNASNARYWRICVRSRWAETLYYLMFQQISAFTGSRNWWMDGQITFDGNVTAALKGVTRRVRQSFAGEVFTAPFPVAPAAGDTFTIKRGCSRTFNACCARLNTENYGGFNDLELQNVINGINP